MFSRLIFKYNTIHCKAIMLPLRCKCYKNSLKSFKTYNFKLENSISRSKKLIYEYALNNNFAYYVTFTFNSNYDSYNLSTIHRYLTQSLRDLRKKLNSDLKWLLIPEKHKKGDYHLHGFLSKEFKDDIFINSHCYDDLRFFQKYGWCNVQNIRNYEACCKYITKYITKELFEMEKGKHCYFISNNLKKSKTVYDLVIHDSQHLTFDYSNDYCSTSIIKNNDADSFLTNIFNNNFYNYYNNIDI